MRKNKFVALVLISSAFALQLYSQNITKDNKTQLADDAIVAPEHLTKKLSTLLHDWQIEFTSYDGDCSRGNNIVYHDSVYTRNLYELPTEMEMSYNQVVKNYIEMYTARKRDLVAHMLTVGSYYFPMFEQILDREGLPLELKYLPVIESALNPVAVSRAGATGLWQFMLRTGQGYGLQVNSLVDERRDPYKSSEAAAKYLKDLYAIYEDWNLVIAAYNCGPGNVNKAITRSGGKRDYWEIYYNLPKETRGYVPAFVAANYVMNNYDKHNICPVETKTELFALDTIHVDNKVHFSQISEVLNIPISNLRRWNPQFKRDQIPGNFKSYALVLPTNMVTAFLEKENEIIQYKDNQLNTHRLNTDNYITSNSNVSTTTDGDFENVYYRVRSGDTLSKIASRNRTTVSQIRSWNNLRSTKISVGKNLIVQRKAVPKPEPEQITIASNAGRKTQITTRSVNEYYRVRRGDNLGRIASKNGVTVSQLKSWNGLRNDNLAVGKSLIVKKKTETVEEVIETIDLGTPEPEPIKGFLIDDIEVNVPLNADIDTSVIDRLKNI